jgi:3-dehydroquinate dehydratase/shikimate dehydrogenase
MSIPFITGMEMFVQQGARQFEIFTGKPAPEEEMFRVVLHALRRQIEAVEAESSEAKTESKPKVAAKPTTEPKATAKEAVAAKAVAKAATKVATKPKPSAKTIVKPAAKKSTGKAK